MFPKMDKRIAMTLGSSGHNDNLITLDQCNTTHNIRFYERISVRFDTKENLVTSFLTLIITPHYYISIFREPPSSIVDCSQLIPIQCIPRAIAITYIVQQTGKKVSND